MTVALYDEVVTVAPARKLTVVRDVTPVQAPAPKKPTRQPDLPIFGIGGDPLVNGAARLLSIPVRHVYAALWRVGMHRSPGLISWPLTHHAHHGPIEAPSGCLAADVVLRLSNRLERLDLRYSVESTHGIDPAITGEPSEEQPARPSRPERVGPSQP